MSLRDDFERAMNDASLKGPMRHVLQKEAGLLLPTAIEERVEEFWGQDHSQRAAPLRAGSRDGYKPQKVQVAAEPLALQGLAFHRDENQPPSPTPRAGCPTISLRVPLADPANAPDSHLGIVSSSGASFPAMPPSQPSRAGPSTPFLEYTLATVSKHLTRAYVLSPVSQLL